MRRFCFAFLIIQMVSLFELSAQSQFGLSGTVTSAEDGMPVAGATVMVQGSTRGVATSDSGEYLIDVKPGEVLEFGYLGLESQFVAVQAGMSLLNITLESAANELDELVVVAYGVRKKGTVAGSVSTVQSDVVENVPTASFDQALQGQVTGLSVMSSSGDPSEAATFVIRGNNSINSGSSPLFILDGAPISSSHFNTINPNDIESISVLKDASSTSIYGARAANGVVIITTKRGKMGSKPQITLRSQWGFSQMAYGNWDMMNTEERILFEQQIGLDEGKDYDTLSQIDVNWAEEVFNSQAPLQSYDLSVSGATESVNYYVSGNYYDQEGIVTGSSFQRAGMRGNFDVRAASWLKVGVNSMFTVENYAEADQGSYTLVTPISAARFMLPYYSPYNEDGSLASINDGTWLGTNENPLEWAENNPLERAKYKAMFVPYVEVRPIEDLSIRSQYSYDMLMGTTLIQSMPSYLPNNESGYAARGTDLNISQAITNVATYMHNIGNIHNITALVGQEWVDNQYEALSVSTIGQKNDLLSSVSNGTSATSWSDYYSSYSYLSFFGRVEYSYIDKYYFDFSLRADASSRFGANNRWGEFWSLGAMWNIKSEEFLKSLSWLDSAQIALSTGTSGNSEIGNYASLALVSGGIDYVGGAGLAPSQKGSPDLTWESTWTTNLALRLGMFNRLNLEVELYNKLTSDMLLLVPTSMATNSGIAYEWQNVGVMLNRGVELSADLNLLRTRNFSWQLSANFSYNYNEILELYNGVDTYDDGGTATILQVGQPVGSFYMNRFAGVNPLNGDAQWYDKDGNIVDSMETSDRVLVNKSYNAPWQGGFGTSLAWKGLSLNAQFSWVADRWVLNNDRYFDESNGRFSAFNQSSVLLDRWMEPGDISDTPRYGEMMEFDTRLLEDASYLRLKNLTVSWAMPASWLERTKSISGMRLYVQGQNLWTLTSFSGLDPEGVGNTYAALYPLTRQYTLGLDLTF